MHAPSAARDAMELPPSRAMCVIERLQFGGIRVHVGGVPTKPLVASVRAIRLVQRGAEFAFTVTELGVDLKRVMAHTDAIVTKSQERVE